MATACNWRRPALLFELHLPIRVWTVVLLFCSPAIALAQDKSPQPIELAPQVEQKCFNILLGAVNADEFWPAMHAAEALTLGGRGETVRELLAPKLPHETDDQQRCGLARELVRAGDRAAAEVMLEILAGDDPYGHTHAAESLYKVNEIGDGVAMHRAMQQTENGKLQLMGAAALGRWGNPQAYELLREKVGHDDPEISRTAAWILARIGDASDIPRLRAGLARAEDRLTQAYFEHALATLGDEAGRAALRNNLRDDDPAVRTYAATFAGDAYDVSAAPQLIKMLDDANLDTRVRAAQTLLVLAQPAPAPRLETIVRDVYPADEDNPRYSEGSIIALRDGSLLFATTEFIGGGSDFSRARIVARRSDDDGRTWGRLRELQENVGEKNVMSVTLRRLGEGIDAPLGMFYLIKNGFNDLDVYLRASGDEGRSFSEPVLVSDAPGYHVMNNDRVTRLASGRLLAPVASTEDVQKVNHFVSYCFLSDDSGATWRKGKGIVDQPQRGAMEPEVLELADGRVLMIVRTQLGHIAAAYSDDGGDTWSEPENWGVKAPEAPSTLRRIPSTGDLLLVWNNTYQPGTGHGGKRTPLTAAISSDEGRTWQHVKNLETRDDETYAYTSLVFDGGRAVLSYYVRDEKSGRISSRFRSLPIGWFYED